MRRYGRLFTVRSTDYFGFELDRDREALIGSFPEDLMESARHALTVALNAGITDHPEQRRIRRAFDQLGEYWRRSGGTLPEVDPERTHELVEQQLQSVNSHEQFLETPLDLNVSEIVPREARLELDVLPKSALVYGDRVPLDYEIENNEGVVRMRIREGQARRLRPIDLPGVDRPLRFAVIRGKRVTIRASDLETLHRALASVPRRKERHHHDRKHRRRRRH